MIRTSIKKLKLFSLICLTAESEHDKSTILTQTMELNMKVIIELEVSHPEKTTPQSIKEAVYQYLLQLIDDDSLDFVVKK